MKATILNYPVTSAIDPQVDIRNYKGGIIKCNASQTNSFNGWNVQIVGYNNI
jgi:hypothetical protein